MVVFFFLAWLVLSFVYSIYDIKIGLVSLISYSLLVPYSTFNVGGVPLEFNYFVLLFFILAIVKILQGKEKIDFTLIRPISIFAGSLFVITLFADAISFNDQLKYLRTFVIFNLLLPIIIWHACKKYEDIVRINKIIIICIVIMCVYGLYCFITKSNPYVTSLAILFKQKNINLVFEGAQRGGFVGRVQSTTFHPFTWSVFLLIAFFATPLIYPWKNKNVLNGLQILIFVNLIICGTRSGIVAAGVGLAVMSIFVSTNKKLLLLVGFMVVLVVGLDTTVFGKYKPLVDSIIFFYDSNKEIGGSSLNLRVQQWNESVRLWLEEGTFIGAKGFGWCIDYYINFGDHPTLYAFESILYTTLIETGIIGFYIWGSFAYTLYTIKNKYVIYKKLLLMNRVYIFVYFFSFAFFITITGLFGLNFFLIFMTLILKKIELLELEIKNTLK